MVIRIPALAYQKGFGGHFHNDNAIGFLREIPGLIIACPSTPREAALLLKACVKLAYEQQRVVIFLEPIALYMVKDLYAPNDGLALTHYPNDNESIAFGELGIEEDSDHDSEIAIISYGNGMYLSRQATHILKTRYNISVKLIDLRWLLPINTVELIEAIKGKTKILIVDECRRTGSLSEEIITLMVENLDTVPKIMRITGEDTFIPLGKAWETILPSCDNIVSGVLTLCQQQAQGVA
jgi:2-oxoisovalerate dehydrogenase E1 component